MPISYIRQFLKLEATAGMLLVAAAVLAMAVANSPLAGGYNALLERHVGVGPWLDKSVIHWINDALMVLFFLLIGLELKRERVDGALSNMRQIILPGIAAVGGMVVPGAIYAALNWGDAAALRGWAIPAATDIAFTLGVMALLGSRIPLAVKVFVTTVAIIDDLGAIVIIAVFYTEDLSLPMLLGALAVLAVLFALNRMKVTRLLPYLALGVVLWLLVLKSGVHATLAGVALAFAIPVGDGKGGSPLHRLEHGLHPWVTYLILPVFAFANAGVHILDLAPADLLMPLPLGIALGLFVGKQLGIFATAMLAIRLRWASMPHGGTPGVLYGACVLCGIGFTMSLFIAGLAFTGHETMSLARLGIIIGSLASAVVGYAVLAAAARKA